MPSTFYSEFNLTHPNVPQPMVDPSTSGSTHIHSSLAKSLISNTLFSLLDATSILNYHDA